MKEVYLTIDDAVSSVFMEKIELLERLEISAIFFCRGDRLSLSEERLNMASCAIQKGFILANHLFSHKRITNFSFDEVKDEILKTDLLIDKAHKKANVERKYKYLRFPYIDRGCGAFPADASKMKKEYADRIKESMGLIQITSALPETDEKLIKHKEKIQDFLKSEGFSNPDFKKVTYKWFKETEFHTGYDVNFTMATGDSNLLPKYRLKGITINNIFDDIEKNFNKDPKSAEVIVMHDYDEEEMSEVFKTIINTLHKKVKFI